MPLLVRDVMTIGVPVCRDSETCGEVLARLQSEGARGEVVVALDEDGMACGWMSRERIAEADSTRAIGEMMEEDIPTVSPSIPAEAAAQLMRDRGVDHLFLMHDWPGEPRPSAVISLKDIEKRLEGSHADHS
ncbi:MAG: CBS domain-containing protein [Chloroflexi bacterium]|nr:CBS domain-containing protein [Chloroflexota bacterium]